MIDGQNGLIQPSTSFLLSPRRLELLAWYAQGHVLILDLDSNIIWQAFSPATVVFAGIGVLLSVCIIIILAWVILTHAVLRQLRTFVQAKTLFWMSLSALNCSSDVSRHTPKCR
jgi:hypothetical protein